MKAWFLLLVCALSVPVLAAESSLAQARGNLRKWGVAYCVNARVAAGPIKDDAARAMAGYFQRGSHDSEEAYQHVRVYFDRRLKAAVSLAKEGGEPMVLSPCLDLAQLPDYEAVLRQQDRYIGK